MKLELNNEQAKGLSNFFFDVAKGMVLGGLGLSLTVPLVVKVSLVIMSMIVALFCLRMALYLLQGLK